MPEGSHLSTSWFRAAATCVAAAAIATVVSSHDARARGVWQSLKPRFSLIEIDLGDGTAATALTNKGQIVGARRNEGPGASAYLYYKGQVEELGTLGGTSSWAYDVNERREVVGWSTIDDEGTTRSFVYRGGVMSDLDAQLGLPVGVRGINSSGQVTGGMQVGELGTHAFVLDQGELRDLGTLGGISSWGEAINDQGMVAGASEVPGGNGPHVFLYRNGVMLDLDGLGCCGGIGNDVNERGDVTGQSRTPGLGGEHAFLYSDGVMRDLGTLGGGISIGVALNAERSVVGYSQTDLGQYRPFLYANGEMHDLNDLIDPNDPLAPYVRLTYAADINDRGEILAEGTNSRTGRTVSYWLKPQNGGGGVLGGGPIYYLVLLLIAATAQQMSNRSLLDRSAN